MTFDEAVEIVLRHEGGYVSHPRDPGGETNMGISRRAYPDEDIRNMTRDRAKSIYRADFWDRCQCDQLPAPLRLHVFDAAVNSGTHRAAIWLQIAVGAKADGIIGARTITAARFTDPTRAVCRMTGERIDFLSRLKTWPTFSAGWMRRIAYNLQES